MEEAEDATTVAHRPAPTPTTGFAASVHAIAEHMRETMAADIVTLYPYDEESDSIFAPVAIGIPESDVVHSLPDMADQLRRFRLDEEQGKTPEDLSPSNYGPNAWLLTTRRRLVSADAAQELDSSFVRRHKVKSLVGVPLIIGGRIVGLLYLNYIDRPRIRKHVDVTAAPFLQRLQTAANEAALQLDAARHQGEAQILHSVSDLVSDFSALPSGIEDKAEAERYLQMSLQHVLSAANLDAAALYISEPGLAGMRLAASFGAPALASGAATVAATSTHGLLEDAQLKEVLAQDNLVPLAAVAPRGQGHPGVLLFADRDTLALHRRLPSEQTLLQTAADLMGAMLNTEHLIEELGETNRTLGAVTRLSQRLLQPGATEDQTLRTAVEALTDPALPELDFEFANIFLLDTTLEGDLQVYASAGATMSPEVSAIVDQERRPGHSRRIPTWAAPGVRRLDPRDVVGYVAMRQRTVVVAPFHGPDNDHFVSGYPEELLMRKQVPILRSDGSVAGYVHAARLREAADRSRLRSTDDEGGTYRITDDFTLNHDLFEAYGHASLVRVFVPFGSTSAGDRATGVLEAGYHISREQRLERVQIEALRACAATIAVAVQTARLYEDVTRRATQLELVTDISRAIVTSIDLEQTLVLIARNMARAVDASVCLIALLEEDGSAWYGAAASDLEEVWRQRRVERPEKSIVFDVADRGRPLVVEDAQSHELVSSYMARLLGIRSLVALPLLTSDGPLGAVILGQRDRQRLFTAEEVEMAAGLSNQAAIAIRNARRHAREEEEHHIQKDVILIGFGQWGQKAYKHLETLKSFFNFRTHVVELEWPGRREALAKMEHHVVSNGDLFYWDKPGSPAPARDALERELEPSCYVITYIATPAETHLPMLKAYYDLSNVILVEKPLGAPPEEYRAFLDSTDGSVQIVAADHYWFKLEVRLLELLLTEERNLRSFLDEIEEVEIELLEEQPPGGSGAQIGMIADLIPHAFAVLSLLTPLDRVELAPNRALQIGMYQPQASEHETYARLTGSFEHRGRPVRVTIDVGKGVANAKWIKLSGQRRMGGRRAFYKFDLSKGVAIDGTQSALSAATRPIRQPGVPDNAHLSMLRHVIEKKNPAVGILSIREAIRANARIQQLERMAAELIAAGQWTPYEQGHRPDFEDSGVFRIETSRAATQPAVTSE
jgi:GAF domain-containing protein